MPKEKGAKNPADIYRKKQRKKELQKNKEVRKQVRETILVNKDPTRIEDEIKKLEALENEGKLDKSLKTRKKQLIAERELVIRKRQQHGIAASREEFERELTTSAAKSLDEIEQENQAKYPNPELSVYYHPVLNPYGAPPPGAKPMYRDPSNPLQLEGTKAVQLLLTGPGGIPVLQTEEPKEPEKPPLSSEEQLTAELEKQLKSIEDEYGLKLERLTDVNKVPVPSGPPPPTAEISKVFPPFPDGIPPVTAKSPHKWAPRMPLAAPSPHNLHHVASKLPPPPGVYNAPAPPPGIVPQAYGIPPMMPPPLHRGPPPPGFMAPPPMGIPPPFPMGAPPPMHYPTPMASMPYPQMPMAPQQLPPNYYQAPPHQQSYEQPEPEEDMSEAIQEATRLVPASVKIRRTQATTTGKPVNQIAPLKRKNETTQPNDKDGDAFKQFMNDMKSLGAV